MIIIVGSDSKKKSASIKQNRSTPTIYQKKKKVRGFVDRISNGIVVVVIRDPEDPQYVKEIYIPVSKFPKRVPEEGEYISITINA